MHRQEDVDPIDPSYLRGQMNPALGVESRVTSRQALGALIVLVPYVLSGCRDGREFVPIQTSVAGNEPTKSLVDPTATPEPTATRAATETPLSTATMAPTATELPEPTERAIFVESVSMGTPNLEGLVGIDQGEQFYRHDFLEPLLKSQVNDEYFRKMGVTDPGSDGAYDQLMAILRANNYEMPPGLTLLGASKGNPEVGVLYQTDKPFRADSLIVELYGTTELMENRKLPITDPLKIRNAESFSGLGSGELLYANKIKTDSDGVDRLHAIMASNVDFLILTSDTISQPESIQKLNHYAAFFRHVLLNLSMFKQSYGLVTLFWGWDDPTRIDDEVYIWNNYNDVDKDTQVFKSASK